jgi:hypothetical protein
MGIDIQTETVIGIGEACRAFPPNGISDATMARFIQKGVKIKALGIFVKLETIKIGGRRYTSKEAIASFIAAQNAVVIIANAPNLLNAVQQAEKKLEAIIQAGMTDGGLCATHHAVWVELEQIRRSLDTAADWATDVAAF